MWHLQMAERGGAWVSAGSFETLSEVAGRIVQLEGYPVSGVFFNFLAERDFGCDDEFLGHLEHTGRNTGRCYGVKRVRH